MKILIIAEHSHGLLKPATSHVVTAARQLSFEIDILVIGQESQAVSEQAAALEQVKRVLYVDAPEYAHQLAENTAQLIADLALGYTHVLAPATTFGKNIMPRVSALLNVGMVGDVIQIVSSDIFVRPIYAGNALATVETSDPIKILTIRSTAFSATDVSLISAPIERIEKNIPNTLSTFVSEELHVSARPELTAARVIVSGGRGLKSAENFKLLDKLADTMGAAIGASRAAVDAGFASNDLQVGQTGKVVAPDLYIAIGISGAIQHVAGMKDSKVIVAINNDPDAPIFQIADYGLVTDLFTAINELQEELDKKE